MVHVSIARIMTRSSPLAHVWVGRSGLRLRLLTLAYAAGRGDSFVGVCCDWLMPVLLDEGGADLWHALVLVGIKKHQLMAVLADHA